MCHARDWRMFDSKQKMAEDTQSTQDRRADVIDTLLKDANKQSEEVKPAAEPIKELAPAK